jgi:hypothetical protein
MTTLEQVEKLREKANVSFEEAKAALDATDGDILDALIYLERQGKVNAPESGGYYSSSAAEEPTSPHDGPHQQQHSVTFGDVMRKLGQLLLKILRIGNTNNLDMIKNGGVILSLPVTAVVLFIIFFFWIVVPLFIVSLFFGFRYRFSGSELGRDAVNKVMDSATDTAEDIKKSFGGKE